MDLFHSAYSKSIGHHGTGCYCGCCPVNRCGSSHGARRRAANTARALRRLARRRLAAHTARDLRTDSV